MSSALVLTGGGFRGAIQVPVIEHLCSEIQYDHFFGVSVGALNAAMAAQNKLPELRELWEGVHGVGGFLRVSAWPFNGFYSMRPLRKKLHKYVKLKDFKAPCAFGVVSLNDTQYYNLSTDEMQSNRDVWEAMEASSSIAGLMKTPIIKINGEYHRGADGGFRNIVPGVGNQQWDHIDVVSCTPFDRSILGEPGRWNTLSSFARGFEITEDEVYDYDFHTLLGQLNYGGMMRIYAPGSDPGERFTAHKEIINRRFLLGYEAIRTPHIYIAR